MKLPVLAASAAEEFVLEIEEGQGARLRVEFKGAVATERELLARAPLSVVR